MGDKVWDLGQSLTRFFKWQPRSPLAGLSRRMTGQPLETQDLKLLSEVPGGKSKIGFSPGPWGDLSDLRASHLRSCTHRGDTSQAAVFSPRCGLRFTGICLLIFWILPDRKETWTFIGRPLVLEQLPGLPRQVRRKSGGRVIPPVGWIVEGVGVTQRGGGAPYARGVPVVEVLQRVPVLVVSLIFWSVG